MAQVRRARLGGRRGLVKMHYFVHTWHGGDPIEDVEGEEFADLSGALEAAAERARDLLIDMLRHRGRAHGAGTYVEITDEAHTVLARVELGDVTAGALIKRRPKSRNLH